MKNSLYTVGEISTEILKGKTLVIMAEEALLLQLPKGNWIGGTIPYFLTENGGVFDQTKLFVFDFSDYAINQKIITYDETNLKNINTDGFENGFSFLMLPCLSSIHLEFAKAAPFYDNIYKNPLTGFVSGTALADIGKKTAKVIDGLTLKISENAGVVMHIEIPANKVARLEIINIFNQNNSADTIEVLETGFEFEDVLVNGNKTNFAKYIADHNIDIKLPLVANYSGAMINTSFQTIDNGVVKFYAPLFKDKTYKLAKNIENYPKEFLANIPTDLDKSKIIYSCNCILNYLYGELEGKNLGFNGTATFGEVAYILLNQTFSYLVIE